MPAMLEGGVHVTRTYLVDVALYRNGGVKLLPLYSATLVTAKLSRVPPKLSCGNPASSIPPTYSGQLSE
jgi:hypothetical protein